MNQQTKILFIEDEALLRSLFKDALTISEFEEEYKQRNFVLDTAKDYKTALNYLEQEPAPALIILDLRLPLGDSEMNNIPEAEKGFELLKKIKSELKFKNSPVLVFTALGDKETERKAIELGADKFMIKSKTLPEQLFKEIIGLL